MPANIITTHTNLMEFERTRTLGLLDQMEKHPAGVKALGWRPGAGRAHFAWQLMHIGITEELFATQRLVSDRPTIYADLIPRFKGGSTPDDHIPPASQIREVLTSSRKRLLETLAGFTEAQLPNVLWTAPDGRELTLQAILNILCWHEAHHQGQAHITLNLFKAANPGS
jgi:hypothetical protein